MLALPAVAAASLTGTVRYEMSVTGEVLINHTDSGVKGNGGDCNLSQDDAHAPFKNQYKLKVSWDSKFKFAFSPSGTTTGIATAKRPNVHGSTFSFSGSFYRDDCFQVSYGKGCSGTLKNHGPAYLIAKLSAQRKVEAMKFAVQPFGSLNSTPPSCNDNESPPTTFAASDVINLASLSQSFTVHAFTTREKLSHGIDKTLKWADDRHTNCSKPGAEQGDTDECSTVFTGNIFLHIEPLS